MALGAKLKLGFIDGILLKPTEDVDMQRWIRCDYMVTCWVLNSIVTKLSDAFLYAQSAYELWKEITERYGQSNDPLIYHLERELSKITQDNLSVASYFNKLKRCWDELQNLNGIPTCSCGKMDECSCGLIEKFLEMGSRSKLIQFLMKLNDEYEYVKSQILSTDPLPYVNKAYYIVQQVEKQKQVTHQIIEPTAFFANFNNNKANYNSKRDNKGKFDAIDGKRFCTHCKQDEHLFDQCFERLGYPDWYKGKKGKKSIRITANVNFTTDDGA